MSEQNPGSCPSGWEQSWRERLPQIDGKIIHFVRECEGITGHNLQRLTDSVRLWFDQEVPHLAYDIDWQRAKSDPHLLMDMLEQRFSHMLHEGQLCLAAVESPVIEE